MHFYLIDGKSNVVNEFDAVDVVTARPIAVQFCKDNLVRCTMAVALRSMIPARVIPPPTVDDQPSP